VSHIPSIWPFALLALAAFRTWLLLAEDSILDRSRAWLVRSERVSEFVSCPRCFGAWCVLAWWGAWLAWPHGALVVAVPFALSAVVVFLAAVLSVLTD
jgi:hypothetical protein